LSHDWSLEPVLRAVEPSARLVPARHLRQVLNYLIDRGYQLPTNTDLPYWAARADLEAAEVLPSRVLEGTEPKLLLVTDPDDRMIEHLPRAEQLLVYWRVLFRAAVLAEFDRRWQAGDTDPEHAAQFLDADLRQFGAAAAREIEYVLTAEHAAYPGQTWAATFRMFAAVYLDLATFDPHAIEHTFPSLPAEAADRALRAAFDVPALLARTRPEGAAEPHREPPPDEHWEADHAPPPPPAPDEPPGGLLGRAAEAERKGNNVRAAILRTQAAAAPGADREATQAAARAAVGRLVDALGQVFAWDHPTRQEWHQALAPLLAPAARGVWPRAARCLYELQTIPADLSREVFAIDLPESIRTFGRRPVKRALPHARPVRILMALKKAHAQLLRAELGHAARLRLDRLFYHQIHTAEHDIRREFTPIVVDALARAGLVPNNTVEEVARDKLVAELLDRVCDRGYLRFGDLRDAIAWNRLKLGDTATGFLTGDALLRADINLAYALDGVYRKGEVYLRGLQRFSSLFFANPLGRLFTLFVVLPFGGAFLTLTFAEEMRHIGEKIAAALTKPAAKPQPPVGDQPEVKQPAVAAPPGKQDVVQADNVRGVDDEGNSIVEDPPGGPELWRDPATRVVIVREIFNAPGEIPTHAPEHHGSVLTAWPTIIGFGVFLLLMIHAPPFRRAVFVLLGYLWRAVRGVFWDWPVAVWRSRAVRDFRRSRPVRFLFRHFWSPLLVTLIVFGALLLLGLTTTFLWRWGWLIWAVLTLAYNTPWGWVVQDRVAEAISDWWRVVRVNLLPGLVQTILDWFRMLANWVERKLYAVDEWFRYRGGDSKGSIVTKAILGLVWFPIAYVFRFAFYLLVEPQVNPIKHFPVVTVSHKMLLPLVVSKDPAAELSMFGELIANQFGTGVAEANFWAFWIIAGIPGVFGFMAWEFVANWQMYRANRARRLRPVMLGSHGETMRGLLRPGFHSGTIPKLFRKLRHAAPAKASRLHHELDHAAEAIHRFVERELIHLLARCPEWGGVEVGVGAIRFGCQRVAIDLAAPHLGRDPFTLAFENVGGRVEATVGPIGWADKLTEPQRAAFVGALRGFLDMAAAVVVDGRDRSEEAAPGVGFGDLARRVSWAEWVGRWGGGTTGSAGRVAG
jgi:hypothetical protein